MAQVYIEKIIPTKIRRFRRKETEKWKHGIAIGSNFYDLTIELKDVREKEQDRIKQIIKAKLMKVSEKIIDHSTNEVTHLIISIRDIEKLNLEVKDGRKQRTSKRK